MNGCKTFLSWWDLNASISTRFCIATNSSQKSDKLSQGQNSKVSKSEVTTNSDPGEKRVTSKSIQSHKTYPKTSKVSKSEGTTNSDPGEKELLQSQSKVIKRTPKT